MDLDFSADWLKGHLKAHPAALRHERDKDRILLTASTRELQAFLVKHAETKRAFDEPLKLKQRDPQPPEDRR